MSDAADKLARSRLAIIEHVYRKEIRKEIRKETGHQNHQNPVPLPQQAQGHEEAARTEAGPDGGRGRWGRARRAARSYWRHHPARMGVQMATPLLSRYARKHPLAYLGIAAAAGALLMAARPWRLISVTGVLVALAKSPQLAGFVMSTMAGWNDEEDEI